MAMGAELWAASAVVAWAGLTAWSLRPRRRRGVNADADTLVVHASQTGSAEALAIETELALAGAGERVERLGLSDLTPERLAAARRLFLVASTTGEGDAPDEATGFLRRLMPAPPDLSHLEVAVLALGDSTYGHYCEFGRRMDQWLVSAGATPLFDRVEVDRLDPGALDHWRHQVTALTGAVFAPDGRSGAHEPWTLVSRTLVNPGSVGRPIYHLRLKPVGDLPVWRAGDIAEIELPASVTGGLRQLRDYSIASVPADGHVDLLIRSTLRPDGTPGLASAWLLESCQIGDTLCVRLRTNRGFHGPDPSSPLILIGNGTGIAGLAGHLSERARAAQRGPAWLIVGERNEAHDALLRNRVLGWRTGGALTRVDRAFSRDAGRPRYVQNIVLNEADALREWVERGATIMVCGSLKGMAPDVDAALREVLGEERLLDLREAGRYRRDVY